MAIKKTKTKNTEPKEFKEDIVPVDYSQEMKQSYIDYSMSVITDRALPDVRDGLKPVHRRILYSMHETGMTYNKSYNKCAEVVGNVLGGYHPHGDSSVYGALVRMAQDFSLRYPLIDGHGNFGSIDGDSAAHMRYCVTGDTLVSTNKGLIKIKNLVKDAPLNSEQDLDINVLSLNNKINHSSKFFNSGIHSVKEVVTECGYSIKGTCNHPLVVLTVDMSGKPVLVWKTIEELSEGDYIVINRSGTIHSNEDLVSENEAKFLGAMVSEGFLSLSQDYHRIGFNNSNLDYCNDMKTWFKEFFGEDVFVGERNFITKNHEDCKEFTIHNKEKYEEFIKKYQFGDSYQRLVPDCILQSSLKTQALFLRYLYEGDGSVYEMKQGKWIMGGISYASCNLNLIKQVQIMLLQFGIYSIIKPDRNNYRLLVYGKNNISLFKQHIDFAYDEKKNKLNEIIKYYKIEKSFANFGYDTIPFISEYIRKDNNSKFAKKYNFSNKNKFIKNQAKFKEHLNEDSYELLKNMHDLNYLYLKVEKINDLPEEPVYCVRIDSDCHSFVANGFINHNTEARLQPLSDELLQDLKFSTVKMVPNFNEKKVEPVVLPSTFPNLLVNGATGIAVGMMTSIPTHNLGESIDCIILGIDKPNSTTAELLEVLKGPDFPTGGIITNKGELFKIYEEGAGSITIRGKHVIESTSTRNIIVITEIPYTLSGKKEAFVEAIIELAHNKKELQIVAVRDESSKEGIRIVVEVKKEIDINTVISYLYKYTGYEDTFKFSFLCLDQGKPVLMSLKQYVKAFVDFQKEIYKNKFTYLYDKNKIQIERLTGLVIAYDYIDEIISMVRKADSVADMRTALRTGNTDKVTGLTAKERKVISKFSFTEVQADVILETKLYELSKLKLNELTSNIDKMEKENKIYDGLLHSDLKLKNHIKKALADLKTKYSDSRRTKITSAKTEFIPIAENYELIVDENNYAKRIKSTSSENSITENDRLCVIVENGASYFIPYKNIPVCNVKDKGVALENFTEGNNIVISFIPKENKKILTVDSEGYGKIIDESEFICSRKVLKGYLGDGKIMLAKEVTTEVNIISKNAAGKEKKFKISELPVLGRTAKGRKVVQGKFEIVSVTIA